MMKKWGLTDSGACECGEPLHHQTTAGYYVEAVEHHPKLAADQNMYSTH